MTEIQRPHARQLLNECLAATTQPKISKILKRLAPETETLSWYITPVAELAAEKDARLIADTLDDLVLDMERSLAARMLAHHLKAVRGQVEALGDEKLLGEIDRKRGRLDERCDTLRFRSNDRVRLARVERDRIRTELDEPYVPVTVREPLSEDDLARPALVNAAEAALREARQLVG